MRLSSSHENAPTVPPERKYNLHLPYYPPYAPLGQKRVFPVLSSLPSYIQNKTIGLLCFISRNNRDRCNEAPLYKSSITLQRKVYAKKTETLQMPIRVTTVQVCDATKVDSSTAADYIIVFFPARCSRYFVTGIFENKTTALVRTL